MAVIKVIAILSQMLLMVSSEDVFSSMAQLNSLVIHNGVLDTLQRYIQNEVQRMDNLKSILKELNRVKYLYHDHPVGVYLMLKLYFNINSTIFNRSPIDLFLAETQNNMPDMKDVEGANLGILRLQQTFKLPIIDLINGKIDTWETRPLTAKLSFNIAKQAFKEEQYPETAEWIEVILDKFKNSLSKSLRKEILILAAKSYSRIPKVAELQSTLKTLFKLYPRDVKVKQLYSEINRIMSTRIGVADMMDRSDQRVYERLCLGDPEVISQPLDHNHAVCRYKKLDSPLEIVKEEVLSLSPYVMFYHDVVTRGENFLFRKMSSNVLGASMVGVGKNGTVSSIRVSKTAWLGDTIPHNENDKIGKLSRRVSRITGLSTTYRTQNTDAESFQVVNYGIGGQYEPHLDSLSVANKSLADHPQFVGSGDRIATFLLYLSDVIKGGATVFPRVGLKVDAIKNGALFWYNLLPSGYADWRTFHAGCPVLLGQKWIANKWVRSNGQMFRRRCGLHEDDTHAALYSK